MYVKWFDTVMFYYVKFISPKMRKMFKFAAVPASVRPDARRDRNTEVGCRHRPGEMAGKAARDASRERRTR
ncbi:unnamed protein product [Staurois parvus]|uniref:Uncharacterized protein n=1 Tax=Staurois parvus TaxID=386267 RepID=A0ABN9FIW4_9NEOB|nr:unnamed protein product [Staurois parvus]